MLKPNEEGDWVNQRNEVFDTFIPIQPDKKFNTKSQSFFKTYAVGVATNRDDWTYNFSEKSLRENMSKMIDFYNRQTTEFHLAKLSDKELLVEDFISDDLKKIKWTVNLKKELRKNIPHELKPTKIISSYYRPYCKQKLYYCKEYVERPGLSKLLFPNKNIENLIITLTGIGSSKAFSVCITDEVTDIQLIMNGQSFPLYYFEKNEQKQNTLFDTDSADDYIKRDGVSDFILNRAVKLYGKSVCKEDIFYYVYGILHSKEFKETFANDLKKMLPRIPLVERPKDFWAFSKAGRKLAELHINYESVSAHPDVVIEGDESEFYTVEKMRFPKKEQKDIIIYNSRITLSNIPEKAYQYVVNGKPAIEWIMERYQIKTDKKSGIKNDPNDWSAEVGNPRYILDLLLSVINVSTQTVDIVNDLPKLDFEKL